MSRYCLLCVVAPNRWDWVEVWLDLTMWLPWLVHVKLGGTSLFLPRSCLFRLGIRGREGGKDGTVNRLVPRRGPTEDYRLVDRLYVATGLGVRWEEGWGRWFSENTGGTTDHRARRYSPIQYRCIAQGRVGSQDLLVGMRKALIHTLNKHVWKAF